MLFSSGKDKYGMAVPGTRRTGEFCSGGGCQHHPELPVKASHTHRDIIKIMHDAEYKSISLQKEEE